MIDPRSAVTVVAVSGGYPGIIMKKAKQLAGLEMKLIDGTMFFIPAQ